MRILIVGFGNMGCRHAQSLIQSNLHNQYFVLEPNNDIYRANLQKIGVLENQLTCFDNIVNLPDNLDFAIIATSSFPRYQILKELIEKGIKYFLLEKIVFQSEFQFNDIIRLMEKNGSIAYCNFVSRYFPNYIEIKNNLIKSSPIKMIVNGGDFGLGCNALHYMDLFEYFTGKKAKIVQKDLIENVKGNRRGFIYKELLGQIVFSTDGSDLLIISAEEKRVGGNEIIITQDDRYDILNEETGRHIHFSKEEGLVTKTFEILYTSYLTNIILNDIMNGSTLLPNVEDTKNCHIELFNAANATFGLDETELCPLT
ncbi:MAG: Gfo/Idh/MocA family oxidoreductase [Sphaerochaetaceae bacterium]|nr:Gfo/Idh/MocA family oxidoreductase [Sphaerochaetaceae bacterium]